MFPKLLLHDSRARCVVIRSARFARRECHLGSVIPGDEHTQTNGVTHMTGNNNTAPNQNQPTTTEAPKPSAKPQTLAEVLAQRQSLIEKIKKIESIGPIGDDDPNFYALEGMRAKLNSIESSFGTLADTEITDRLFKTASALTKDGIIGSEARKYLITFEPGSDPAIAKLEGKKADRASGEKRTKRKFAWFVDGKTEDTGATEVIRVVSDAVTLVRGEYVLKDVLGVSAVKGWKVAPSLGPVAMRQQGKKVTTKKGDDEVITYLPHDIMGADGKPIKLIPAKGRQPTEMYAHKFALVDAAKDPEGAPVKWALGYLRDLIGEEMVKAGATKHKKATRDEMIKYLTDLHKDSEKAHASELAQ